MKLLKSEEKLEMRDKDLSQICFLFRLDFPIPLDALFCFIVEVKERGLVLHYIIADPHTGGVYRHPAVGLALSEHKSIFSIPGHVIT